MYDNWHSYSVYYRVGVFWIFTVDLCKQFLVFARYLQIFVILLFTCVRDWHSPVELGRSLVTERYGSRANRHTVDEVVLPDGELSHLLTRNPMLDELPSFDFFGNYSLIHSFPVFSRCVPPACAFCGLPLTVKHILLECTYLWDICEKFFVFSYVKQLFRSVDTHTPI